MLQFDSCPNCFAPLNGRSSCPRCDYNYNNVKQPIGVLEPFTALSNRYLVGRVLGKGGFGVTYISKDIVSNKSCAIKEYMPAEYSKRESGTKNINPFSDNKSRYVFNHGREKFVEEARTLYKLKEDPIVVDIWDYFNENNTAYLVMELLEGMDLRKRAKLNHGTIDPSFAKDVFLTVASSLMEIHKKNILHRDLSPENIFVTNNNEIKLIDFGAARNYVSTQNKGMSILLKPGFAPPEQYSVDGVQGPWSDVYALCATFYNVVSGRKLIDALYRYRGEKQPSLYELGCPVTKRTSDVIEKGMELDFKRRYKNFGELLDDIDIEPTKNKTNTDAINKHQEIKSKVQKEVIKEQYPNNQLMPNIGIMVNNSVQKKISIKPDVIYTIGRSVKSCSVVIGGDSNISRVHCTIKFDSKTKKFIVEDCSSNGTFFANGNRLVKNNRYQVAVGNKIFLASPNHTLLLDL
jgi:serine/threonine protein kinase